MLIGAASIFFFTCTISSSLGKVDEWWRTAVIYQIYPRSFKDSNNDGNGDLNGITSKLPYLKKLGVDAIWMNPIFKSPMIDGGYDISDYRSIDPMFGTEEDFAALIAEAKQLGIKVLLEFVPNYTSDQHEWFVKSTNRESGYEDYYVWLDCERDGDDTIPPNNWISVYSGSAWSWNEKRQQCYYHTRTAAQPDLNYRNPEVIREMKDLLSFYLDKGVYGFQIGDAVHLVEDDRFLDEPTSKNDVPPDDYDYLDHIYTYNQNGSYDIVYQFRTVLDEYTIKDNISRLMMVEAHTDLKHWLRYYGNETHRAASFPLNLFLLDLSSTSDAYDFVDLITQFADSLPEGETPNWMLGNHNQQRSASKHGPHRVNLLNILMLLLPGTVITYMGDEIGMEDGIVGWEETRDPWGLSAGPIRYAEFSRDPERVPFQWNDDVNAGFNEGAVPWLPVNDEYQQINVAVQVNKHGSHYEAYNNGVVFRKLDIWKNGKLEIETVDENVFTITWTSENFIYYYLFNVNSEEEKIDASELTYITRRAVIEYSTNKAHTKGEKIRINSIVLAPYEVLGLMATNRQAN